MRQENSTENAFHKTIYFSPDIAESWHNEADSHAFLLIRDKGLDFKLVWTSWQAEADLEDFLWYDIIKTFPQIFTHKIIFLLIFYYCFSVKINEDKW